jgi:DUF3000 family protein
MGARKQVDAPPAEFAEALTQLREARFRPEVFVEEMPAPQRIAPHAAAVSADVTVDGDDVATGRLVVLYDPAGNDAWQSTFRCVAYVRAAVEPEMVTDALLGGVGWTWLIEALADRGAEYVAPSGTVTRVVSESFGGMADDEATAEIEIRASWSPVPGPDGMVDVTHHAEAWGEVLCTAAGLPPVPPGVVAMPTRRGQRGR